MLEAARLQNLHASPPGSILPAAASESATQCEARCRSGQVRYQHLNVKNSFTNDNIGKGCQHSRRRPSRCFPTVALISIRWSNHQWPKLCNPRKPSLAKVGVELLHKESLVASSQTTNAASTLCSHFQPLRPTSNSLASQRCSCQVHGDVSFSRRGPLFVVVLHCRTQIKLG